MNRIREERKAPGEDPTGDLDDRICRCQREREGERAGTLNPTAVVMLSAHMDVLPTLPDHRFRLWLVARGRRVREDRRCEKHGDRTEKQDRDDATLTAHRT